MKRTPQIVAITLIVAICVWAHSQSRSPQYTTIVIDCVGRTDHPVFPIIISSSAEEAERYRQELFSDPITVFVHVYIVRGSALTQITNIPMLKGDLKQSSADNRPQVAPVLSVVVATGHNSKKITVDAEDSIRLLSDIRKCVPGYPPVVEELSEMEGRMHQYRKQPK